MPELSLLPHSISPPPQSQPGLPCTPHAPSEDSSHPPQISLSAAHRAAASLCHPKPALSPTRASPRLLLASESPPKASRCSVQSPPGGPNRCSTIPPSRAAPSPEAPCIPTPPLAHCSMDPLPPQQPLYPPLAPQAPSSCRTPITPHRSHSPVAPSEVSQHLLPQ